MPKRLLIVDDEKNFTLSIRRLLELSGYETEEAHSGSEVYPRMLKRAFDLVILDYMMPDVKGDKVCEMIRSEDRLKNIPIIIVTAYHDQTEERLRAWGATEVVYKPVETDVLIRMVKKYLE
ncbi:MAG TPA: response regulator [Candidatus Eisenbacteria bacterium]|nr:response regulator [Candidatus Eisenbacteria bacterium]